MELRFPATYIWNECMHIFSGQIMLVSCKQKQFTEKKESMIRLEYISFHRIGYIIHPRPQVVYSEGYGSCRTHMLTP